MWLFLTARLRQWIVMAFAVPALLGLVRLVRGRQERRTGPSTLTRTLARFEQVVNRRNRARSQFRP